MKVVYVVPNWKKHDLKYTTVSLYIQDSIPLEMLYVKSMLKKEIELEIIDANLVNLEFDILRERIKDSKADVMIFNTTINYILWRCPPVDLEIPLMLMDCCKDLNITTIAIGPHTSVDPKEVFNKLGVDYLINGEPEFALADFLNSDLKDLSIKGLYGKGVDNGVAPEIDMTALPLPSFECTNLTSYGSHSWSEHVIRNLEKNGVKGTILEYSRGCVFHCPYCFRRDFRNTFRKKTVSQMEEEILTVKNAGIGYIYFIDEIFNIDNPEWREVLSILKREGMLFGCQSRPDTMSYEMIDLMKESGCIYMEYGVESFSEDVLKAINKSLDKQKLLRIIAYTYQLLGKENVELGMINFFTEDIMEVLDITCTGKWNSKVLRPYPNSPIGDSIYSKYNVTSNKWEFLLRFIWWEQIENFENYLGIEHDLSLKEEILFGDYEQSKEKSYTIIAKYITMAKDRR